MKNIGVLMMGPSYGYLEQELERRFEFFRYGSQPIPQDFIALHAESIHAIVSAAGVIIDARLIDALPNLKIIACFSVGVDCIDMKKCAEKGIRVTNTPDVLNDEVADTAIALMIAVLRRICVCDNFVRNREWLSNEFPLTTKLSGKRVGIIGLGRIGTAIAKRVEAFDCPISYISRSEKPNNSYKYYSTVTELASNCDILVVACDLNPETRHIVNREVIEALGARGVLINIGRGGHVNEPELVSALVEGRLGGAGLDVFEDEPHVPEELFGLENVVLLPHVGTNTVETGNDMADLVLKNLEAHYSGKFC